MLKQNYLEHATTLKHQIEVKHLESGEARRYNRESLIAGGGPIETEDGFSKILKRKRDNQTEMMTKLASQIQQNQDRKTQNYRETQEQEQ